MHPLELRKDFLARSAGLLRWSSPSIAASLSKENLLIAQLNETAPQSDLSHVCLACGSIDTHLRTTWLKQNRSGKKTPSKIQLNEKQGQTRVLTKTCNLCGRISRYQFPGPSKHKNYVPLHSKAEVEQTPVPSSGQRHVEKKSAATSGKQRAKTRKEGLQELLDKSRKQNQPAAEFALMDFMRKT